METALGVRIEPAAPAWWPTLAWPRSSAAHLLPPVLLMDYKGASMAHLTLSGSDWLQAALLLTLAMVVCPLILALVLVVVVHEARMGRVHELRDILSEVVFAVLALVATIFIFRAWRRMRRGPSAEAEIFPRLVLAAPWLALLGLGAGVWMGTSISASHEQTIASLAQLDCRRALGDGASDAEIVACLPAGVACYEAEKVDRRLHPGSRSIPGPDDPTARCVRQALGAPRKP